MVTNPNPLQNSPENNPSTESEIPNLSGKPEKSIEMQQIKKPQQPQSQPQPQPQPQRGGKKINSQMEYRKALLERKIKMLKSTLKRV
jgi:hypothetical protein